MEILNFLVSLLISGVLAFAAYKVAEKNGKNTVLWAGLTFVFGLLPLGILLYKTGNKALAWVIFSLFILSTLILVAFIALVLPAIATGV